MAALTKARVQRQKADTDSGSDESEPILTVSPCYSTQSMSDTINTHHSAGYSMTASLTAMSYTHKQLAIHDDATTTSKAIQMTKRTSTAT